MVSFFPLTLLVFTFGLNQVKGQGYHGGSEDTDAVQQPARRPDTSISSLPNYEGSQGTNDYNYWWLKGNPFQKPANHPGIEKSDKTAEPVPTVYSPSSPHASSNPGPNPQKNTPTPPKEFKYRPITTPYNSAEKQYEDDDACMLRIKSDCHAGGSPPFKADNPPSNELQYTYSSQSYSGSEEGIPETKPNIPLTPVKAPTPQPTSQYLNNQASHSGSTGNSYNQQQQYTQPQYNQVQQYTQPQYQQQQGGSQGFQSNNYEEQPPFPGCPAAMLCVPDDWCNGTGYSQGKPVPLTPAAKAFRVAVMACTNIETNEVGICCRDPDYVDPWPQGGSHEHHHEHKPSNPQYQPQVPQAPQTQTSYSTSQSYRPQQPQNTYQQPQPAYQQPQPAYQQPQPAYQQPQQTYTAQQAPPLNPQSHSSQSLSSSYRPQQQQPVTYTQAPAQASYQPKPQTQTVYAGQQVQSQKQPQQGSYSASQTYQEQPVSTGQSLQQLSPSQAQQTAYGGGGSPSFLQQSQQQIPAASENKAFHSCRPDEECVESYNCHFGFIQKRVHRIQPSSMPKSQQAPERICMPNFGSIKFICCKKVTGNANESQEPSDTSSSKEKFDSTHKKKQPSTSPTLVTGHGFPDNFDPNIRSNGNPYGNQQPIYLITTKAPSTTTEFAETFGPSNTPPSVDEFYSVSDATDFYTERTHESAQNPSGDFELPSITNSALHREQTTTNSGVYRDPGYEDYLQAYNPPPLESAPIDDKERKTSSMNQKPIIYSEDLKPPSQAQPASDSFSKPQSDFIIPVQRDPAYEEYLQAYNPPDPFPSTPSLNATSILKSEKLSNLPPISPSFNLVLHSLPPVKISSGELPNETSLPIPNEQSEEYSQSFSSPEPITPEPTTPEADIVRTTAGAQNAPFDDQVLVDEAYESTPQPEIHIPSQQYQLPDKANDEFLESRNFTIHVASDDKSEDVISKIAKPLRVPLIEGPVSSKPVPVSSLLTNISITAPSQSYELPLLSSEEHDKNSTPNITIPSIEQLPPKEDHDSSVAESLTGNDNLKKENKSTDVGIRGAFPTRKEFVNECPNNMKCLRESYCQVINLNEGNVDQFDVRVEGSKSQKIKCKQANLPVDGVCCYLKEGLESTIELKGVDLGDSGPNLKKINPAEVCGIKRPNVKRSDRADSTNFGEFPWQIILSIGNKSCGGAIVSHSAVLTSGSCVQNAKPESVSIRVGEWDLAAENESKKHQDINAVSILRHPKYSQSNRSYDIALVFAEQNFTFDYHISRVCLPQPVDTFERARCISTGWSPAISAGNTTDERLKQADFRFLSRWICEQQLSKRTSLGAKYRLPESSICATVDDSVVQSACFVNDGGPLVCENAYTGEFLLVGVLSQAMPGSRCGNLDTPLVYANISQAVDWIYDNIKSEISV